MKRLINAIIATFLLAIASILNLNAQISPGDLAEVHAHLEGISNCTKCHTLGDKVSDEKCLDCHDIIREYIQENRGYHVSEEVKEKACFECHNDHHGRNFEIIRFDADQFNHDLSGYNLQGAHKDQECEDCHQEKNILNPKLKEKDFTYLGLETNCLGCHEDYHQGTLENNCLDCHNYEQFRPAPGFDHSKTNYILRGRHMEVECVECHPLSKREGKEYQQFAGIEYASCASCHEDVHNKRFGQNCSKCHTEESFHLIKEMESFDHDQTNYPLEGKHLYVDCKDCHQTNYTDPLEYSRCLDCHDDFHQGQFIQSGIDPDCKNCHDVTGFEQSSFDIDRHQKTDFPLEGAHMATPCFACHLEDDAWTFVDLGDACVDCHEDIHEPAIDKKYYPEADCRYCHEVSLWENVRFDHDQTNFSLQGAHLEQSCRDCHFIDTNGQQEQRFSDLGSECMQCHEDIHFGQFEEEGRTPCENCHAFEDWAASRFNHNETLFKLEGKHAEIDCGECHPLVHEESNVYTLYKTGKTRCEDCH